ncbi:MAG TPA: RodZ domain-containing protein [Anaerolineales bacterium]|nr:RodZ domain-containing protein [Anaerolineales bacterium]
MTQSIGQKLRQAREQQRITLEHACESTRIRVLYLQALEADDISVLASPVQARGFLRNYAEYLGLDFDRMLDELRAETTSPDEIIGPADFSPPPATPTSEPLLPGDSALQAQLEPAAVPQTHSPLEQIPKRPNRRGSKKAEPISEPIDAVPAETASESAFQAELETVVDEPTEPQPENPPAHVSDSLWQNWLNRVSPLIQARKKRVTEAQASSSSEEEISGEQQQDPDVDQSLREPVSADQKLESVQIFKEIGEELRQRRELLSLNLDEVEHNTHVKAHYLEALEKGAMEDLPSTVQTRGMLSNYATFLDVDVDALLLRYADALQARHREKNPQKTVRKAGQPILASLPPIRSFMAGDMIFGIGMAILLIGFSIWGINRVMLLQSQQEVQPTGPSISDVLLASPDPSSIVPTETLVLIESLAEPTATIVIPTQNLNVSVQVNLVAVERTFMRVEVDGEEVFNGRVVPGTAYPFEAEEQIEILVGNGAAIRIVYNGRDLGLLGSFGQVINNIYMADEIITPTIQATPSPTRTLSVTATVPATLTPVPTTTTSVTATSTNTVAP